MVVLHRLVEYMCIMHIWAAGPSNRALGYICAYLGKAIADGAGLHGKIGDEGGLWQLDLKRELLRDVGIVEHDACDCGCGIARHYLRVHAKLLVCDT